MLSKSKPIIEESLDAIKPVESLKRLSKVSVEQIELNTNPYEQLDEIHKLATRYRANFLPYKYIQKRIKEVYIKEYGETTLHQWFDKGGMCRAALDWYRKKLVEQTEADLLEINNKLKQAGIDSLSLLADSLVDDKVLTESQKATARDLADRAGFPKVQRTDFQGKIESDSTKELAASIRGILERR